MKGLIEFDHSAVAMWHSFNCKGAIVWWLPCWIISFDRTWTGLFSALVVVSLPHRHANCRRVLRWLVQL